MTASRFEIEGMIARSRGAVPVTLKGEGPETLVLPAATRRVLITAPEEDEPLNLIDGVQVGTMPPPPGYELTLERYYPEWDPETGVVGWPPPNVFEPSTWITALVWPDSDAPESAQIRAAAHPLTDSGVKGRWILDLSTPVTLVYQDGYWVITERPD